MRGVERIYHAEGGGSEMMVHFYYKVIYSGGGGGHAVAAAFCIEKIFEIKFLVPEPSRCIFLRTSVRLFQKKECLLKYNII